MTPAARSRSRDLLQSLLKGTELSAADVCRELSLAGDECEQFLAGAKTMSVAQQLSFATLLIERVPRLTRQAQSLRTQALAAKAYDEGATISHTSRPVTWSSLKARRA